MVGDDYEADVRGARGVGMQSIWVTRRTHGTLPEKRQSEATIVVASLGEIPPLLIAT